MLDRQGLPTWKIAPTEVLSPEVDVIIKLPQEGTGYRTLLLTSNPQRTPPWDIHYNCIKWAETRHEAVARALACAAYHRVLDFSKWTQ